MNEPKVMVETRGRLDPFGGTLDFDAFSEDPDLHPATINWALDKGIIVKTNPFECQSQLPPKSGLGLSGALTSAILLSSFPNADYMKIAKLAHNIENVLGISLTGYQDQLASLYGGINFWQWRLPSSFTRIKSDEELTDLLSELVSIYYSGESHNSTQINQLQLESYTAGKSKDLWRREAEITWEAKDAQDEKDVEKLIELLNESYEARKSILPQYYTNECQDAIIKTARNCGGGAKLAGSGAGGCVYTLSNSENQKKKIKEACGNALKCFPNACEIEAKIGDLPAKVEVRQ